MEGVDAQAVVDELWSDLETLAGVRTGRWFDAGDDDVVAAAGRLVDRERAAGSALADQVRALELEQGLEGLRLALTMVDLVASRRDPA